VALDIVCNIYINISSKGQHEKKELKCIQSKSVHDEIKLFICRQVVCAMGAMWCFYGYQDYPASILALCSFKVRTPEQLDFIVRSGKILDLQFYYNRPTKLDNLKYVDLLKTYNT
jgi:hypothetical protein